MTTQTSERARPGRHARGKGRRRVAAAALAIGLVGVAGASASSLGGLSASGVGADRGAVASCDRNGVSIFSGRITFDPTVNAFTMKTFSVRKIARACRGRTLSVTVHDPSNASLASLAATVGGHRVNLTLPTPLPVSQIAGIAVAID